MDLKVDINKLPKKSVLFKTENVIEDKKPDKPLKGYKLK
jgi:hypothetical protein